MPVFAHLQDNKCAILGTSPNSTGTWNDAEDIYVEKLAIAKCIKDPQQQRKAVVSIMKARENSRHLALEALGQGLHALQDIDAHMQIFAGQSVSYKVHADGNGNTKTIDDTQYDMYVGNDGEYYPTELKGKYNSDRYKHTELESIEYIKRFKEGITR